MNISPETKEYIDEYVEMRVSKSKQVYDKMQRTLHDEIKEVRSEVNTIKDAVVLAVAEAVKVTVNGKIDRIKLQLDSQDEILKKIGNDTKPAVKTIDWIVVGGKVIMWICLAVASIGGAIFTILKLIEI